MKNIYAQIDELQKKINEHRPLPPHLLEQIKEYYRVGLTYTSNALEGNSLTESETKVVLEDGITIGGKRLIEHLEVIGHSDAYTYLYNLVKKTEITEDDIKWFHHLFYFRIDENRAGEYRTQKAFITGSKYPLPLPKELSDLMEQLIVAIKRFRKEKHPAEAAALAHKEFIFIHPFVDGNGRVARLLMNLILLQEGFEIAIIPPIMRNDYIRSLEKAHIDDADFLLLVAKMAKETQQDYIRLFI
jgi:Fic family protein